MNKETINTFDGGLVMDLNPMSTPNNVLVGCLNGTLITFNGNENVLQNDMGNGRVETANLPEGYIPIGTCSHGGFIYIVSYNPLKNLAQIGSFPSPERNIDSTELSDRTISLRNQEMYIYYEDMEQDKSEEKLKEVKEKGGILTTDELKEQWWFPLKPLLRKEFEDIILNPGDKFIIFANDLNPTNLSDYGNINHIIGDNPQLWKIRIASLEESGKVTELDNLKWYKNENAPEGSKGDYYINHIDKDLSQRGDVPVTVDSYRSLVNSPYSIFTPKKSGNICLLISPEYVDSFTATASIYLKKDVEYSVTPLSRLSASFQPTLPSITLKNRYHVFINSFWECENEKISPDGIIVKSYHQNKDKQWEDRNINHNISFVHTSEKNPNNITKDIYPEIHENYKDDYPDINDKNRQTYYVVHKDNINRDKDNIDGNIERTVINDDIINYIYKKNVKYLYLKEENIPTYVPDDSTEHIYKYEVYPYNKAGYFPHLKKEIIIDYSKVGKEIVSILGFKYYVEKDNVLINLNLEAYTLLNYSIDKLWFEFYNDKGVVAYKVFSGLSSYNGELSTRLNLDTSSEYYGLTCKDPVTGDFNRNTDRDIIIEDADPDDYEIKDSENKVIGYLDGYYTEEIQTEEGKKVKKVFKYNPIIEKDSLYLVKIRYTTKKLSNYPYDNESSSPIDIGYRWLWTTQILNSKYNEVKDFKDVQPELQLASAVDFSTTGNYNELTEVKKEYSIAEFNLNNTEPGIGTTTQTITSKTSGANNLKADIYLLFENSYNDTFQINASSYENKVLLGEHNISETDNKLIQEDNSIIVNEALISSGFVFNSKEEEENAISISKGYELPEDVSYISSITGEEAILKKKTNYKLAQISQENTDSNIAHYDIGFKAELKHESKYLVSGKEETRELPLCKSVISEKDDFYKYNLVYSPTNLNSASYYNGGATGIANSKAYYRPGVAFNSGLALSTWDRDGHDDQYTFNPMIISYSENDIGVSFFDKTWKDAPGEHKYNYLTLLNDSNSSVKSLSETAKFLFPVFIILEDRNPNKGDACPGIYKTDCEKTWGGEYQNKVHLLNTDYKVNSPLYWPTSTMKRVKGDYQVYGGFLGCVKDDKSINIDFNHIVCPNKLQHNDMKGHTLIYSVEGNNFQYYAKYVLGMLTSIYFKSEKLETRNVIVKDKYSYYSPHVYSYIKDIVVISSLKEKSNPFKFKDQKNYYDFIGSIKSKAGYKNTKIEASDLTIDVAVNSCIKTCPLQFNINYIQPDLQRLDLSNTVIIKSYNPNYNGKIINCSYGTLYTLSDDNGEIKLSTVTPEYKFPLKTCDENYNVLDYSDPYNTQNYFTVPNLLTALYIDNDILKIKESMETLFMNNIYNYRGHTKRMVQGLTKYDFFKFSGYNSIE